MAREHPDLQPIQAPVTPPVAGSTGGETERALRDALQQRAVLLHELDHRVKNNLQLIASLMMLQIRRSGDPAVREALEGMLERLNAVAIVHRRLFQNEDAASFDAAEFVRDLVEELTGALHLKDIRLELDLQPASVSLANAAPLALLLNELISNALRHAFPHGRRGALRIKFVKSDRCCRIEIRDDGVGMGETTDRRDGFGRTIVDLLSRQLEAQVIWSDAQPGVKVEVELPVDGD
jgi:two-component sensor histidine kinase